MERIYLLIACAAVLPAPIAVMTVAAFRVRLQVLVFPGVQLLLQPAKTELSLTGEIKKRRELLNHFLFLPSINLNGIKFWGEDDRGLKFSMPDRISATLDIRLVRNMSAGKVLTLLQAHLLRNGFEDVSVRPEGIYDWYQVDPHLPEVEAVLKKCSQEGLSVLLWPHSGGGGPWSLFKRELSVPVLRDFGAGFGGGVAAPDEYVLLESENPKLKGFLEAEKFFAELFLDWAGLWK